MVSNFSITAAQNPDPCAVAKQGSEAATAFAKDSNYITAKIRIRGAASDGKEHSVSFGKHAEGSICTSAISSGNQYSSRVSPVPNRFADLHNHPDNSPPFSGDLYGFIDLALGNRLYHSRYIVTQNQTVYALTLISREAAINFNGRYPRIVNPGYQPRFPDEIVDEFRFIRDGHGISEEMAMAFILEKYNTGVALLKQNTNGEFKRLYATETIGAGGNKIYTDNICR